MKNKIKMFERVDMGVFCVLLALGAAQVIRYLMLADAVVALTILVLETLIGLFSYAAWRGRMPFLLLPVAAGGFVLNSFLNYGETTHFASLIVAQAIVAAVWAVAGTGWMLHRKQKFGKMAWVPLAAVLLIVCTVLMFWKSHRLQACSRLSALRL